MVLKKTFTFLIIASLLATSSVIISTNSEGNDSQEHEKWDGKTADYGWYDQSKDYVYEIKSGYELKGFSNIINGEDGRKTDNFSNKTIILTEDIDLGGFEWRPIGEKYNVDTTSNLQSQKSYNNLFKGIFDGKGHAILNLKISKRLVPENVYGDGMQVEFLGLFLATDGATIKNLNLKNVNLATENRELLLSGLIGEAINTIIENVTVDGRIGNGGASGLVGRLINSKMIKCCNETIIESNQEQIGGLAQQITVNEDCNRAFFSNTVGLFLFFEDCANRGNIISTATDSNLYIGHLFGTAALSYHKTQDGKTDMTKPVQFTLGVKNCYTGDGAFISVNKNATPTNFSYFGTNTGSIEDITSHSSSNCKKPIFAGLMGRIPTLMKVEYVDGFENKHTSTTGSREYVQKNNNSSVPKDGTAFIGTGDTLEISSEKHINSIGNIIVNGTMIIRNSCVISGEIELSNTGQILIEKDGEIDGNIVFANSDKSFVTFNNVIGGLNGFEISAEPLTIRGNVVAREEKRGEIILSENSQLYGQISDYISLNISKDTEVYTDRLAVTDNVKIIFEENSSISCNRSSLTLADGVQMTVFGNAKIFGSTLHEGSYEVVSGKITSTGKTESSEDTKKIIVIVIVALLSIVLLISLYLLLFRK